MKYSDFENSRKNIDCSSEISFFVTFFIIDTLRKNAIGSEAFLPKAEFKSICYIIYNMFINFS